MQFLIASCCFYTYTVRRIKADTQCIALVSAQYTTEMEELHVFGYGSLIWQPDFKYSTKEHGYICGYQRRFWQRNTEQRGTEEKV